MNKKIKSNTGSISLAVLVVALAIFCLLGLASCGTIDAGHRGVVTNMGRVTGEVLGEGIYFKAPFIISVKEMDVRIQKEQIETGCASKDLQTVHAVIALNLHPLPEKVSAIYQTIGVDYLEKVVSPAMQESVKAIVSKYTAEELVTKRELVRESIHALLQEKLIVSGIKAEQVNIVNLDFSRSFNQAIEAKVTAQQNALAAENLLAQKTFEAQQAVATAKGKADSMAIESKALLSNPAILQLRALEKWDGKLPTYLNGPMPFITISEPSK